MTFNYTLRHADTCPPARATEGSAGYDLTVDEPVVLPVGATRLATTGVSVAIPHGHVGLVIIRSSFGAKMGISLANQVGVIDSDYTGEIMMALRNGGDKPMSLQRGTRAAQLLLVPLLMGGDPVEVDALDETARGAGGFGSTGSGGAS